MNSFSKFLYTFLLLFSLVRSERRVIITKTVIQINRTYLENYEMEIIRNGTAVDIFVDVKRDYPRDLWVTITTAKRDAKTKKYVSMLAYELDICRLFGRKNPNDKFNWIQIWFENYWKQGNMPRFCPIRKGNYFWKSVRIDRNALPPFMPPGRYCTTVNSYFKAIPKQHIPYISLTNVSVYGKIHK